MKTTLVLSISDATTGESWFDEMSKEEQKKYVEEHPHSKYAKGQPATTEKKDAPNQKTVTPLASKFKEKVSALTTEQQKFFKGEDHVAGSKPRRTAGQFFKDKAAGVVKAMKHEVKEWKTAGSALVKASKGEKLSDHDKSALKAVALHVALTVGPMLVTGGLSAGLAHALPNVATHLLEHSLIVNFGRAAAFASSENDPDALMLKLVEGMGDAVAKGKIPDEAWFSKDEA